MGCVLRIPTTSNITIQPWSPLATKTSGCKWKQSRQPQHQPQLEPQLEPPPMQKLKPLNNNSCSVNTAARRSNHLSTYQLTNPLNAPIASSQELTHIQQTPTQTNSTNSTTLAQSTSSMHHRQIQTIPILPSTLANDIRKGHCIVRNSELCSACHLEFPTQTMMECYGDWLCGDCRGNQFSVADT